MLECAFEWLRFRVKGQNRRKIVKNKNLCSRVFTQFVYIVKNCSVAEKFAGKNSKQENTHRFPWLPEVEVKSAVCSMLKNFT